MRNSAFFSIISYRFSQRCSNCLTFSAIIFTNKPTYFRHERFKTWSIDIALTRVQSTTKAHRRTAAAYTRYPKYIYTLKWWTPNTPTLTMQSQPPESRKPRFRYSNSPLIDYSQLATTLKVRCREIVVIILARFVREVLKTWGRFSSRSTSLIFLLQVWEDSTQNLPQNANKVLNIIIWTFKISIAKDSEWSEKLRKSTASAQNNTQQPSIRKFASASRRWSQVSHTVPLSAWTHAPGQLNPDRDKIFNFSTTFSEPKFRVNLDCEPKFNFGAFPNQALFRMAGPRVSSQLNPDRDKIFQFQIYKRPITCYSLTPLFSP